MGILDISETGLSLLQGDQPGNVSPDPAFKPTQIMRMNLPQSTLEELVDSLRKEMKVRLRLGKHQTLHYGSRSQQFHSCSEKHRSEVYRSSPTETNGLYFAGVLSHSLEVQKAKEDTAATDEALANLEQSLNAFERGKESRKTPLIASIHEMRALGAGDNRSATGKQAARLARMPTSKIDVEKERFFQNAANRSIPGSPALGVTRSPASVPALTPTSAPASQSKDKARLEALRVPFIHLLAIRAVSIKYLAQRTHSSQEDCQLLARKHGIENRLNKEKVDLRDKTYRELDVWNFPYPSQDDRQEAIENAISAFDRQRISRSDKLWQMLLPKEERGKGKVLSRLDLRTGPIKKALTPRIQVQATEDLGKDGYATGHESDRTNGRLTPNVADTVSSSKLPAVAAKKRSNEKDATATTKRPTTKAKNTTLSGRVMKKTERKATAKPEGKFKSEEYVRDSDEEDAELADAPASPPTVKKPELEKTAPSARTKGKVTASQKNESNGGASASKTPKSESLTHGSKTTPKDTNTTFSKTLPSPSARSSKPNMYRKPSPLGSSPSMNMSDHDHTGRSSGPASSSSSSPLITQVSRQNKTSRDPSLAVSLPRPNGVQKPLPAAIPVKRKAADLTAPSQSAGRANGHATDSQKRQRTASSPSISSSGSASPPLSQGIRRQQLREKSQTFKQYYAKYRALHNTLATHPDPPQQDLDRLERQHARLERMKNEIWEEDKRLRAIGS
jgi:RNA polymerase II elongation factor ELL